MATTLELQTQLSNLATSFKIQGEESCHFVLMPHFLLLFWCEDFLKIFRDWLSQCFSHLTTVVLGKNQKDFGAALPLALPCPRTVCWWCHRCWPTWSDKSCSTWVAVAAPEASRPVSLAAEDKVLIFYHLNSSYNQWAMLSRISLLTLEWLYKCC